ncbi:MAG: hypothetical protein ACRD37_03495 [Candidatus Acidiferrales bacterium]
MDEFWEKFWFERNAKEFIRKLKAGYGADSRVTRQHLRQMMERLNSTEPPSFMKAKYPKFFN